MQDTRATSTLVSELADERRDQSVLRLASRFQSLSSLQSAALHDFRGSLNALNLSVRLLEDTLKTAPAAPDVDVQRRCVRTLRDELTRLEKSTGTLLDAGRPDEAGRTFSVSTVVDEAAALIQSKSERQQVVVTAVRPPDEVRMNGHAGWIRHALLNLACNALQAMPEGGALRIELRAAGAYAVVSVSDTGRPIADDIRERMWDLYYSTGGGLGIGLPVVAHVVHAHGGTVTCEPSDTGNRFEMRLPIAR